MVNENDAGVYGGGIEVLYDSSPTISDCDIIDNTAWANGGIGGGWGDIHAVITHCTISGNSSEFVGGGFGMAGSPTITYCIEMVKKDAWVSMDLGEWSMMAKGGASLAPFHGFDSKLPDSVIKEVRDLEQKILNGTFRVPIDEEPPESD